MAKRKREDPTRCKHDDLYPDYLVSYRCGTPFCHADEAHCKLCGYYVTYCGCGAQCGIDGWPRRRRLRQQLKARQLS